MKVDYAGMLESWRRLPGYCAAEPFKAIQTLLTRLASGELVVARAEPTLSACSNGSHAWDPMIENAEGVPKARAVYRAMIKYDAPTALLKEDGK